MIQYLYDTRFRGKNQVIGGNASLSGGSSVRAKLARLSGAVSDDRGIDVGVVQSARYPIGVNKGRIQRSKSEEVAQVAFWNEFGTQGPGAIPSRPFMRNSIDDMIASSEVKHTVRKIVMAGADLSISEAGWAELGNDLVAIMQKAMKNPAFPPNAPFTKLQKAGSPTAHTKPLIDTRLLTRSIAYARAK